MGKMVVRRFVFVMILAFLIALISACATAQLGTGTPQDVQAAISKGADVNARDSLGMTALMYAAQSNSDPEVIITLLQAGADMEAKGPLGRTALMIAAQSNQNSKVIAALLKAGADVNMRDTFGGMTALMYAATYNPNPLVTMALLEAGADAKMRGPGGKTAFDYAEEHRNLKGTDAYWRLKEAQD